MTQPCLLLMMLCSQLMALPEYTGDGLPAALVQEWPEEALPTAEALVQEAQLEALPQPAALAAPERSPEDAYKYKIAAHYLKSQYDIPQHVIPAYSQLWESSSNRLGTPEWQLSNHQEEHTHTHRNRRLPADSSADYEYQYEDDLQDLGYSLADQEEEEEQLEDDYSQQLDHYQQLEDKSYKRRPELDLYQQEDLTHRSRPPPESRQTRPRRPDQVRPPPAERRRPAAPPPPPPPPPPTQKVSVIERLTSRLRNSISSALQRPKNFPRVQQGPAVFAPPRRPVANLLQPLPPFRRPSVRGHLPLAPAPPPVPYADQYPVVQQHAPLVRGKRKPQPPTPPPHVAEVFYPEYEDYRSRPTGPVPARGSTSHKKKAKQTQPAPTEGIPTIQQAGGDVEDGGQSNQDSQSATRQKRKNKTTKSSEKTSRGVITSTTPATATSQQTKSTTERAETSRPTEQKRSTTVRTKTTNYKEKKVSESLASDFWQDEEDEEEGTGYDYRDRWNKFNKDGVAPTQPSASGRKRAVALTTVNGRTSDWRQRVRQVVDEGWGEIQENWQQTEAELGNFEAQLRRSSDHRGRQATANYGQHRKQWAQPVYVEDYSEEEEQDQSETRHKEVWTDEQSQEEEEFINYEDEEKPPQPLNADRRTDSRKTMDKDNAGKDRKQVKMERGVKGSDKAGLDEASEDRPEGSSSVEVTLTERKRIKVEEDKKKSHGVKSNMTSHKAREEVEEVSHAVTDRKDEMTNHRMKVAEEETANHRGTEKFDLAKHRVEAEELSEYTNRRRGQLNRVRVETSSVFTYPPPTPPSALSTREMFAGFQPSKFEKSIMEKVEDTTPNLENHNSKGSAYDQQMIIQPSSTAVSVRNMRVRPITLQEMTFRKQLTSPT